MELKLKTIKNKHSGIEDELADIMIYSIMLASNLDINIEEIILNKLRRNNDNYPVEKS